MHFDPIVHAFAGNPLDRLGDSRPQRERLAALLSASDARVAVFAADRPLVALAESDGQGHASSGAIAWLSLAELDGSLDEAAPVLFLGVAQDGAPRLAAQLRLDGDGQPVGAVATRGKFIDLRSLAVQGLVSGPELGILAQARSLAAWHARHRFCANCGAESAPADGGTKRACAACGAEHFPRTDPVAIMLVHHRGEMLLGRQPHFLEGVYSALAGFVEPGESIEEAARREIFEESGVRVGRVSYHSSQPWPFPSNLMIGLFGEALGRDLDIDREELEDARWFTGEEVAAMLDGSHDQGLRLPPAISIAHQLARSFVSGKFPGGSPAA